MLEKLFKEFNHIIFLDLETSGLDPLRNEIIELGAMRATLPNKESYFDFETDTLIQLSEGTKLPDNITRITGITNAQLAENGIKKEVACAEIAKLLDVDKPLIVAYNAQFDLCFLYYFLKKYMLTSLLQKAKFLDALTIYKDRRDYPHRLEDAIASYELRTSNTHRALDDSRATFALLRAMEAEYDDLDKYVNLFGYNPRYGISGQRISSVQYVPQPYSREKKAYE